MSVTEQPTSSAEPSRTKKAVVYTSVGVFLVAVVVITVWAGREGSERIARLSAETPATVTKFESDDDYDTIEYTYVVNGREYTSTDELGTPWYSRDEPVKACHDPANPADSRLVKQSASCGR